MNITVYVPKELEPELKKRAEGARVSPSLFIQSILREALSAEPSQFSEAFAALAGSWEDERTAAAIVRDIAAHRTSTRRREIR